MAIDFFIAALLLFSLLVNLLALYAFRLTPSLQTRSNSFVINLLLVNVLSGLLIAPCLLLNSDSIPGTFLTISGYQQSPTPPETFESRPVDESLTASSPLKSRPWLLDAVAALGALSLALVVGDTWSAITDPLRYHSRLSTLKVWLLIAAVWLVGITFGIGSVFRAQQNLLFTAIFCALIVLAPFCLICGMYWRIFREARENGLRMRQNGSSPLLQSALNLVSHHSATHPGLLSTRGAWELHRPLIETIVEKSPSYVEGLTLKIDGRAEEKAKLAASTSRLEGIASGNGVEAKATPFKSLMNLPMKRNESLRQMFLFGVDDRVEGAMLMDHHQQQQPQKKLRSDQVAPTAECLLNKLNKLKLHCPEVVRHVHSTPDLQRYLEASNNDSSDPSTTTAVMSKPSANGDQSALDFQFRSSGIPLSSSPPKNLSYMTSIRHRLSNASSLFKYREESRAARISILVVIMFLASYIPYGILVAMEAVTEMHVLSGQLQTLLAILVLVLANLSSPIIFVYRNKRVRRAVKRMLGLEEKELLPSSLYFQKSQRLQRKKTISAYKKNLILKSGVPAKKMHKLLISCPLVAAKCDSLARPEVRINNQREEENKVVISSSRQNGYENCFSEEEEKEKEKVIESGPVPLPVKSTRSASTTSTIRCEDAVVTVEDAPVADVVLVAMEKSSTNSLLSRLGFIRNQTGNVQKFGVSV